MNLCVGLFCAISFLVTPNFNSHDFKREVPMARIKSEPQNNLIHEVSADLDNNSDVIGLIRRSPEGNSYVDIRDLQAGDVVLARVSNRDALILSCLDCSPERGGSLKFRYLANGINDTYKETTYKVVREGNHWELYTADGIEIETLTLKSKKVLGQVVGISKILINSF